MQDCGQNWYCNHIQITVERRIYLFLSILLMDSYVNNNKKNSLGYFAALLVTYTKSIREMKRFFTL